MIFPGNEIASLVSRIPAGKSESSLFLLLKLDHMYRTYSQSPMSCRSETKTLKKEDKEGSLLLILFSLHRIEEGTYPTDAFL
jgi:hypothetical protein